MRREYLTSEWSELGSLVSDKTGEWNRVGERLLGRWSEPHRAYHDERHLEDVLLALNHLEILGEAVEPAALLSAWFHDAVYRGEPGVDERQSAELAQRELEQIGVDNGLVESVRATILATQPGVQSLRTVSGELFLDADLAILGSSPGRYQRYTEGVRLEYPLIPDDQFRRARSEILASFLDRDTIYQSESARSLWESRARANIAHEIRQLRSKLP